MERLTIRNSEGIGVLKQPFECERCGDFQWRLPDLGNGSPIDKLADYEDTGITPEQIREIDRLYTEKCRELAEIQKSYLTGIELANIAIGLKKLWEYQDLEEQSRLLKLPCTVGDTIYIILGTKEIEERKVVRFKMIAEGWAVEVSDWLYLFEEFEKTVFLTRKEAEAALKNLQEAEVVFDKNNGGE